MDHIGINIRAWRKFKGMSQGAVVKISGQKREYLSKIENGELKNPTIKTVEKIINAIGITWVQLMDGPGEKVKDQTELNEKNARELKDIDREIHTRERNIEKLFKEVSELRNRELAIMV
jgi:transcriptional regulator with XRE-family HTH domain